MWQSVDFDETHMCLICLRRSSPYSNGVKIKCALWNSQHRLVSKWPNPNIVKHIFCDLFIIWRGEGIAYNKVNEQNKAILHQSTGRKILSYSPSIQLKIELSFKYVCLTFVAKYDQNQCESFMVLVYLYQTKTVFHYILWAHAQLPNGRRKSKSNSHFLWWYTNLLFTFDFANRIEWMWKVVHNCPNFDYFCRSHI